MSARRETMHTVIEVEGIIVIVFLVIWAFALLPLLCEAFALPPFVGPEEAEMLVQIMEQFPHGCDKKTARTFLHLDADGNAKPKKELVVSKVVTKMFYGHKGAMRQTTVEDSLQGVVGAPAQDEPRLTHEEAMAEEAERERLHTHGERRASSSIPTFGPPLREQPTQGVRSLAHG